jgi:hypothetical protein
LTFVRNFRIMGPMHMMTCLESAFCPEAAAVFAACLTLACHPQKEALCPCEAVPPARPAGLDEDACVELLDLDAQVTLMGAVRKAIGLLREKNYQAIFEEIAFPQDVEDLKEDGYGMDEIVDAFAKKRADILLQALESIVESEPELSGDGATATFTLSGKPAELSPSSTITMVRLDGKWYLKN